MYDDLLFRFLPIFIKYSYHILAGADSADPWIHIQMKDISTQNGPEMAYDFLSYNSY